MLNPAKDYQHAPHADLVSASFKDALCLPNESLRIKALVEDNRDLFQDAMAARVLALLSNNSSSVLRSLLGLTTWVSDETLYKQAPDISRGAIDHYLRRFAGIGIVAMVEHMPLLAAYPDGWKYSLTQLGKEVIKTLCADDAIGGY